MTRDEGTPLGKHLDLLQLDAARAGEATEAERQHLDGCALCRKELRILQGVAREVTELQPPAPKVSAALDEAVLAEYRRSSSAPKVVRLPSWRWAAPALGVAVAAGLAWLTLTPPEQIVPARRAAERVAAAPSASAERKVSEDPALGGARAEGAKREAPILRNAQLAKAVPVAGDVTGDGRVDILDAYRLALLLEEGRPDASAWDETRDGAVDQRDVEALATLAVAL